MKKGPWKKAQLTSGRFADYKELLKKKQKTHRLLRDFKYTLIRDAALYVVAWLLVFMSMFFEDYTMNRQMLLMSLFVALPCWAFLRYFVPKERG